VLEPQAPLELGKNPAWARFIQKVYEVDPRQCPECGGRLKVISFITDPAGISPQAARRLPLSRHPHRSRPFRSETQPNMLGVILLDTQ